MSTTYYCIDKNGTFPSPDGKIKFKKISGSEIDKLFMKEPSRKKNFYYFSLIRDGEVSNESDNEEIIAIETTPKIKKKLELEDEHTKYLNKQKKEYPLKIISANQLVKDAEGETEIINTIVDPNVNVEEEALHNIEIENLHKALKMLNPEEYELIYDLFLADTPQSVRTLGQKYGVHFVTISKRKKAILKKLKLILENDGYKTEKIPH